MKYRYYICDVFTRERFGGNQLAVLSDARGLDATQMQQIAREFNFSETTFVFPPEAGQTRKVRIFTPGMEVPFAGHPNIGTAFALAKHGEFGDFDGAIEVVFEEEAGLVPVAIRKSPSGDVECELKAPAMLSFGQSFPVDIIARALSLEQGEIITTAHAPRVVSVGLGFILVEVRDYGALKRACANIEVFGHIAESGVSADVHLYLHSRDEFDIRSRMFAPLDGIPEDPATGSANCALAALLADCDPAATGRFGWRIAQGVEMGRPSLMLARAEKHDHEVTGVWIGGSSVLVAEGTMLVD